MKSAPQRRANKRDRIIAQDKTLQSIETFVIKPAMLLGLAAAIPATSALANILFP